MKIQCNVCEAAEATVLCCADEAALCYGCDEKVHAANKLASKHQRVSLSNSSSPMPKCDICQETVGYFFCLEDRAFHCRKCDVSTHSINAHVSAHQRFLLTGVKVGLEPIQRREPSPWGKSQSQSPEKVTETESRPLSKNNNHVAFDGQQNNGHSQVGQFAPTKSPFGGRSHCGSFQQWQQLDEIFGIIDHNQNYNFIHNGSSKADSGKKLGESDCSAILLAADFKLDGDECLGHVTETAWDVPEIPLPPTASGLNWPNNYQHQVEITPAFVPDVCYSTRHDQYHDQQMGSSLKRKKH